jgi:membrane protein implicated in regulation of membrane protease activity
MHWAFLVLALLAALAELHTGTFYLAAVAVAAGLIAIAGFWISDSLMIFVFVLLCALLLGAVALSRRTWVRRSAVDDLDIGQAVSVCGVAPYGRHLIVRYRGVEWEAVMDDGSIPEPNAIAIITRKTDKLLHLKSPPAPRS